MQSENVENQPKQPQKNPSRENQNISSGEQRGEEKRFDTGNEPNRNPEIDPGELDRKEIDLDRSGIDNSKNRESANFGGEKGDAQRLQNSRGAQGSNSQGGANREVQQNQQQSGVKQPQEGEQKNFGNQGDGQRETRQGQGQNQGQGRGQEGSDFNRASDGSRPSEDKNLRH